MLSMTMRTCFSNGTSGNGGIGCLLARAALSSPEYSASNGGRPEM